MNQDFFGGNKPKDLVCQKCEDKNKCSEAIMDRNINWKRADGNQTEVLYNQWRNQCVFREEVDVLDNLQVLVAYENGVKVSYLECHYTHDDNREYIFIGTKGKLKLDDANDIITVELKHGMYNRKEKITFENLQSGEGQGGGDKYILDDFINALSTGQQPNAGGEEGFESIESGLVAYSAITNCEIVTLPHINQYEKTILLNRNN